MSVCHASWSLMRWFARWNQPHGIQSQFLTAVFHQHQVAIMHRIKRTSKDSQLHSIAPFEIRMEAVLSRSTQHSALDCWKYCSMVRFNTSHVRQVPCPRNSQFKMMLAVQSKELVMPQVMLPCISVRGIVRKSRLGGAVFASFTVNRFYLCAALNHKAKTAWKTHRWAFFYFLGNAFQWQSISTVFDTAPFCQKNLR